VKVGFIGLGRMGSRMAQRLLDAGLDLAVYDAMPERAAALTGARPVAAPRELGPCEAVLVSVTDGAAVLSALEGPGGLLSEARPDLLLIELTTIGVADSARVADACLAAGVRYVRSPLLGTLDSAAAGKLIALVSGPSEAAVAAAPLLAHLCAEQRYLGPGDEGRILKLLINGLLAAGLTAVSEALAVGQKAGLSLDVLLEAIAGSPMASPAVKGNAAAMRERTFEPRLTVSLLAKDLRLLNELAASSNTPAPVASTNLQLYEAAANTGLAELDSSAIVLLLERLSGLG
jgi:3-hydroxyisobutyrate dehydrogenase-like beta-hydroxyacid dehydrogenase